MVAGRLRDAVATRGEGRLLLATGRSQIETLAALARCEVDWKHVEAFHLDEYLGISEDHPAGFRHYLRERFLDLVPVKKFHAIRTVGNPDEIILQLTEALRKQPIDVGLVGIGENAHIAFNDPPANFITKEAFLRVQLDDRCRRQQVGEGWFSSIAEVPSEAISMSVYQIMQCKTIVSAVPHLVKADAISRMMKVGLSNEVPATILKSHHDYHLFLDHSSASGIITFPRPIP